MGHGEHSFCGIVSCCGRNSLSADNIRLRAAAGVQSAGTVTVHGGRRTGCSSAAPAGSYVRIGRQEGWPLDLPTADQVLLSVVGRRGEVRAAAAGDPVRLQYMGFPRPPARPSSSPIERYSPDCPAIANCPARRHSSRSFLLPVPASRWTDDGANVPAGSTAPSRLTPAMAISERARSREALGGVLYAATKVGANDGRDVGSRPLCNVDVFRWKLGRESRPSHSQGM